tara:strand:+ start:51 stop:287 length:237 start_codon:yes stop_codon:yes gene_type:complete
MTDQQQHLQTVIQQSNTIVSEMNKLNRQMESKRETLMKLQGVAEYLSQIGVTLPTEEEEEAPAETEAPEEVAPAEVVS